jgi:uncharacterized heparinase superfamily protein
MARDATLRAGRLHGAAGARRGGRAPGFHWPLRRVGAKARQLLFTPPDPWPGDAEHGRRLLARGERETWAGGGDGEAHRFAWLRDLRAAGGDVARRRCQALIASWIAHHGRRAGRAVWAPDVIADRIVHWLGQFDFYGKPAPQSFKGPFFRSMAHQARALARAAPRIQATPVRVRALRALVSFGSAVPGAQARLELAIRLLRPLLEAWPASGVIAERNPSGQLAALRDLVDIRAFLTAAHHEPPPALDAVIARGGRALAALRHGDGALALFHGGAEEDPVLIDVVLALAGAEAAAPSRFSGGFERACRGESVLLLDAAPAPPSGHAGALAFEFSAGAARLVVNCGAFRASRGGHAAAAAWHDAGRVTAAHSTLILGDRNSAKVVRGGVRAAAADEALVDIQEEAGAVWIAASHAGYARRYGVLHRRRLFLAADGADLRGEDRLVPIPGRSLPRRALGAPFSIRFHMHPDVSVGEAELGERSQSIPFGSADAGPWQLVAESGLASTVEESLYLGRGGAPLRCRQIVLAGRIECAAGAEARWAIRRMR